MPKLLQKIKGTMFLNNIHFGMLLKREEKKEGTLLHFILKKLLFNLTPNRTKKY